MEPNPQVDFIFRLCADLDHKSRVGVAISVLATEAARIAEIHPGLKAYMDERCGLDWMTRQNGGIAAAHAFITFINDDSFNNPRPLPPATIEA